jgi:hypothetical protein
MENIMSLSMDPNLVFRDGPSTNPNGPEKWEIRRLLSEHQQALIALIAGAGSGLTLPNLLIYASEAGGGTPNAIQAATSLPIPVGDGAALIALNISSTNSDSPVTVSFNGAAPLTVKTNSGNNIVPNGLAAGSITLGLKIGTTFRLVSDQASAVILAAAEAAADRAGSYAAMLSVDRVKFNTVQSLLADSMLSYSAGTDLIEVGLGDVIEAEGFRYQVVSADSTDIWLVETSGGVKLRPLVIGTHATPYHWGAVGDGTADDTAAVQAWAAFPNLNKKAEGVFRTLAEAVISLPFTILDLKGARFVFPTTGNASPFRINAAGVSIIGGHIQGPYTGTTTVSTVTQFLDGAGNGAIRAVRSYDNRMDGLSIIGTEIEGFGDYAVFAENVNDLLVTQCHIHHNGYNGVRCYGCFGAKVNFNHIHHIFGAVGVGASPYWNAYGVAFTRRPQVPSSGDPLVVNPPSQDCEANFNWVHDVTTWKALDTHGGKRCNFIGNYGTNVYIAIGLDEADTSGLADCPFEDVLVSQNRFSKGVVETGGLHRPIGVAVFGKPANPSLRALVIDNDLSGFGGESRGQISMSSALNVIVKRNRLRGNIHSGVNVISGNTASGEIEGNELVGLASGGVAGIAIQSVNARFRIGANWHRPNGSSGYVGVSLVAQDTGFWVDLDHQETDTPGTVLYIAAAFSRVRNGNIWTRPFHGDGSPEGVVSALRGMTYTNRAGGAGATFWVKETGSGNTGWVAK